jgi:hypothetical protein
MLELIQQYEVLDAGSDIKAFKVGMKSSPSLTRITITSAAHGILFCPLYHTPMIR